MRRLAGAGRPVTLVGLVLVLAAGCTANRGPHVSPTVTGLPSPAADAGRSDPVADPVYPDHGNPALDVLSYTLDLRWSPEGHELSGTATLAIRVVRPVPELALDFAAYAVDSATVDGAAAAPTRRDGDLVVPLATAATAGQRVTLAVRYHGVPHPVPMPSARRDFPEGLGLRVADDGSVWTMQEPFGAFTWYPANDQPSDEALYDVAVTVPPGWAAVAHGALVGVDQAAGGPTYHWRSVDPVATYLATLAIGRYTQLTDTGPHGLPLTYWIRTGVDEDLTSLLRRTPELLGWLEGRFGPYPFPSAGVVLVESTSAMETQQMVTLGTITANGQRRSGDRYTNVLLHELAHQWFGDAVTPRDWRSIWLSEGFATYVEMLWTVDQGQASESAWRDRAIVADQASRSVAGPPGHFKPEHFAEGNVYYGPALMLGEIRHELGDGAFFGLLRDWVQTQRNQPVDRASFTAFVNAHAGPGGKDLTALIDRWLDSPTTPAQPSAREG